MAEQEELFFFQVNVEYPVGVRFHPRDAGGFVLSNRDPYVAVEKSKLRDFRRTNFYALDNGLIKEIPEPPMDISTPNTIDDADAAELVKNVFALKKALASVTSPVPVRKLLQQAEKQGRPTKTIKMIQTRLGELEETDEIMSPAEMQGVE